MPNHDWTEVCVSVNNYYHNLSTTAAITAADESFNLRYLDRYDIWKVNFIHKFKSIKKMNHFRSKII